MWVRLWNKLRFLLRRGLVDREISEELEFHRAMLERDQTRAGADADVTVAVRRQLGNTALAKEASRDEWSFAFLDAFLFDLRLVVRSVLRERGFTAAAVLTFALGIGANIAVFTVLDRLMFRPLPFAAPDRLVQIHSFTIRSSSPSAIITADLGSVLHARAQTIEDLAYVRAGEQNVTVDGFGDAPVSLAPATANLLHVLGIRPAIGRDFTPDDRRERVGPAEILLTDAAWRSHFGGSETIVDRVVGSGHRRYRIVGVLPATFILPSSYLTAHTEALVVTSNAFVGPPTPGLTVAAPIGRLRPGVTVAQAQAELDVITGGMSVGHGGKLVVVVQLLQRGLFFLYSRYLWLIVTAVGLVLGVACVNLATLLLARGGSHERDIATRTALGASSARLIAWSIIESGVLCFLGCLLALGVCAWTRAAIISVLPPNFQGFAVAHLDGRLWLLTFSVGLVSAIVAGLIPVLASRKVDLIAVLRHHDRSASSRLRGGAALLAAEAALGVLLVTGAAVTVPSFARLVLKDPGFKAANLYTLDVVHGSEEDGQEATRYSSGRVRGVLDIVRSQAGVIAAGAVTQLPLGESSSDGAFWQAHGIEGAQWGGSRGFFEAFGTRLDSGRDFTDADVDQRARVAILNRSGEHQLWPAAARGSAIGQTLTTEDGVYTVIGVVADIQANPGASGQPALFVPITAGAAPHSQSGLVIVIRMASGQTIDPPRLGTQLAGRFPARPVGTVHPVMDDLVEPRLQRPRFLAIIFGALASISLILAAVGITAVSNCELHRRRHEIAVRVALGASSRGIRNLTFARVVRPVATGAVVGGLLAWTAGGFLQAQVFDVDARAPWTLAMVGLVIVLTSVVAGWAPARRAAATDPIAVLRES